MVHDLLKFGNGQQNSLFEGQKGKARCVTASCNVAVMLYWLLSVADVYLSSLLLLSFAIHSRPQDCQH